MRRILFFWVLCTGVSAASWLSAAELTFDGPVTINRVPAPPVTVHSGDFNKDGKIDLVVSNGSSTIGVLLQDPVNRERWTQVTLRVGSSSFFTRGGDFDGDGVDDLIVADGASTAYYVRSVGDGTFEKPLAISQARGARWAATGDWNLDGRLDLASSNLNTSTLSIFLNELTTEGKIQFRQTQNPSSGREHTLEALDYDGDGLLDLALGTGLPGIQLHQGKGDGSFVNKANIQGELSCVEYISIGDFNKDGKDDISATCIDDATAYVAIAGANGRYQRTLADAFAAGTEASAVGDFNRDGSPDLALVSAGSSQLRIHPGLGNGKFGKPMEFGQTGPGPLFLIARDLDGDGYTDIVSADTGGSTLTIFHGQEGDPIFKSSGSITGFVSAKGFGIVDFDQNGTPDIILSGAATSKAFVYLNPGESSPNRPDLTATLFGGTSTGRYSTANFADLNGDSIPDLFGTQLALNSVLVSLLDSSGKAHGEISIPVHAGPQQCAAGRVDGGPTLDIVVPCQGVDELAILLGHGDGKFDEPRVVPTIDLPRRASIGDLNGDQKADLLVWQPRIAAVHFQNGDGSFSPPVIVNEEITRIFTDGAIVDLNGDGRNDLVLADSKSLGALFFGGLGDGTFAEAISIKFDLAPLSLHFTDVDGDGLLDLTAGSTAGQSVVIVYNLGSRGFSTASAFRVGVAVAGHRVIDMNGDGVPDIVASGSILVATRIGRREGSLPEPLFHRGDADNNGKVEITDPMRTLNYLFRAGEPLPCEDAADTNDDGKIDLTDAVDMLNWLFLEGPEPRPPGPGACGTDPRLDDLKPCKARC